MALKNWKKRGEDWYQLKKGKGELFIQKEPYEEVHRINGRIVKVVKKIKYQVVQSYSGDGGQPDYHGFKTKIAAHNYILNRVRTKDY